MCRANPANASLSKPCRVASQWHSWKWHVAVLWGRAARRPVATTLTPPKSHFVFSFLWWWRFTMKETQNFSFKLLLQKSEHPHHIWLLPKEKSPWKTDKFNASNTAIFSSYYLVICYQHIFRKNRFFSILNTKPCFHFLFYSQYFKQNRQ